MNLTILHGNVGKDPEVKRLESGKVVAKFSLATSESYTNTSGEKITETDWHNCVFWGKPAETVEKYVKKGSSIIVEGKIKYRSYENKDKVTVYITEIICERFHFAGSKKEEKAEDKQGVYQKSGDVESDIRSGKFEDKDMPF